MFRQGITSDGRHPFDRLSPQGLTSSASSLPALDLSRSHPGAFTSTDPKPLLQRNFPWLSRIVQVEPGPTKPPTKPTIPKPTTKIRSLCSFYKYARKPDGRQAQCRIFRKKFCCRVERLKANPLKTLDAATFILSGVGWGAVAIPLFAFCSAAHTRIQCRVGAKFSSS